MVFSLFIQALGFINFFFSVAAWASLQRHIIFEFDASSLNNFLIAHWSILIILELATVFLSSSENIGNFKSVETILYILAVAYISFSPYFSFSWISQCNKMQNLFIGRSNNHSLDIKATKYLNEGQCSTSQQCTKNIQEYMSEHCFRYPKIMRTSSYVFTGMIAVFVTGLILFEKFYKKREVTQSEASTTNA